MLSPAFSAFATISTSSFCLCRADVARRLGDRKRRGGAAVVDVQHSLLGGGQAAIGGVAWPDSTVSAGPPLRPAAKGRAFAKL